MKKLFVLLFVLGLGLALLGCDLFGTTTTTVTTTTTADDPNVYDIANAADLLAMDPWKNYRLTADIDLAGAEWTPIGTDTAPYSGTFEGQNHTISDFTITRSNDGYAGFFGYVTGDIKNLRLTDVTVNVNPNRAFYAGLLVGYLTGNLTNIQVNGTLTVNNAAGSTYAGLLAGFATTPVEQMDVPTDFIESVLRGCRAEGRLTVATKLFGYVGGLVGKTFNVELNDCRSTASLTASAETDRLYVGGLVGHNYGGYLAGHADAIERDPFVLTERCAAVSKISVVSRGTKALVGGLFGYDGLGHLEDCFAYSEITAAGALLSVGGLVGESWTQTVLDSVVKSVVSITPSEGQTVTYGGVAGFFEDSATAQGARFLTQSATVPTVTGGTAVTAENLASATWYQTALGWNDSAWYDSAIAVLDQYSYPT
ncbi:MAG TPA: hypothetical protein PLZ76_06245, partial [Bacillota bacterium]|nr:hypothetical protein [Bacillota bacterium]